MTLGEFSIPPGFAEMEPFGPFHQLVGPFYATTRNGLDVVGMRVAEQHCNKGAIMHGGMLLMLADTAMTYAGSRRRPPEKGLVTTSLSSEMMAAASPGDWIEAEVSVLRAGKNVMFLNCLIRREGPEGPPLMRCSATFQVLTRRT